MEKNIKQKMAEGKELTEVMREIDEQDIARMREINELALSFGNPCHMVDTDTLAEIFRMLDRQKKRINELEGDFEQIMMDELERIE